MSPIVYPHVRRDESIVDNLHGVTVKDPYRWLEDPDSEETKKFIKDQNKISDEYLNASHQKEDIHKKLSELWDFPKLGVPHKEGSKYFFSKNSGLQNQNVIYVKDSLDGEARVFFDPNTLSEDGTISLMSSSFSDDGSIFAYGLSESGSDWISVRFKNVETGKDYPEVLEKLKFTTVNWTRDNKGVFYGCYLEHATEASGRDTASHENQKLMYHRIGTAQSEDILCVEFPDQPKYRIGAEVSDCGRYLIVSPGKDCRDNLVYYSDLGDPTKEITKKLELTQVVHKLECDYEYVTNTGSKCIFRTNKNAPNYQLMTIDLNNPDESDWKVLIPEHEKDVLEWSVCVNKNKLIVCFMRDVKHVVQVHDLETGKYLNKFDLDIGAVVGASGKKKDTEFFFKFSSMIIPGVIYHVDMTTSPIVPKIYMETKVQGFDQSQFKAEQIFYSSKDGTKIPMFIVSKKGAVKDGKSPCLLYGYGGFNISLTPRFSVSQIFFAQHFGFMAIPNIRGGGEYGENWNNAGRRFNIQNCFDDFQCAAEYLIKEGYTNNSKLTIKGGSHGGLLVSTCMNQRPELYGAVIADMGVLDMLRFNKFTIGYAWCADYGNPDDEDCFKSLIKFSPLHNVKIPEGEVQYPCALIVTADHDDRVVPSHSLKLAAQLQYTLGKVKKQTNPLLINIETKAGHGNSKPTSKVIEQITNEFCFISRAIDHDPKFA